MRAQMRDRNEPAIRKRAEALGFLWLENNASTKGRPDACLLRRGCTLWCEVKVQGEPFTPAQMKEFPRLRAHGVEVYVLETVEDVDRLSAGVLPPWTGEGVKVWSNAGGRKRQRPHRPGVDKARTVAELCRQPNCIRSFGPGGFFCLTHQPTQAEPTATPAPKRR